MLRSSSLLAIGLAALCIHCADDSSDTSAPASATNDVIQKDEGREQWVCHMPGDKIVEIEPAYGEIHRTDLNAGTWSMEDGLSMEVVRNGLSIKDDEGTLVAAIDSQKLVEYGADQSAKPEGSCERFFLKKEKPTSAPFAVTDDLEYTCDVSGGVQLVIRPGYGEIDELHVNDGKLFIRDGMSFTLKSLESSPPKNQLAGVDDEGTAVGTITEDDRGVTWANGEETGTCTKATRQKR